MKFIEKVKGWLNQDHNALKIAVLALIAIGAVLIYTVGSYASLRIGQPADFFFSKYIPYVLIGLGFLAVGSLMPKKWIVRISAVWLIIGLIMMACTMIAPDYLHGSARYVNLFGRWIDPFMLTLPAYIVMMAHWLSKDRPSQTWTTIGVSFMSFAIIFLALSAPYVLMSWIYLIIFVIMAIKARKNMPTLSKVGVGVALANVALVVLACMTLPHVWYRLCHLGGYATALSLKTISSCSLIGTNQEVLGLLARSVDPITDFAFTSVMAQYGLISGILLLALYYFVVQRLAKNSRVAADPFYALMNVGAMALLGVRLFFSLTTSFGILPVASYLPLVSYSPLGLLTFCALLGFVFSEKGR